MKTIIFIIATVAMAYGITQQGINLMGIRKTIQILDTFNYIIYKPNKKKSNGNNLFKKT